MTKSTDIDLSFLDAQPDPAPYHERCELSHETLRRRWSSIGSADLELLIEIACARWNRSRSAPVERLIAELEAERDRRYSNEHADVLDTPDLWSLDD